MIRLLAFDLDGTAILQHKYLSDGNRRALELAHRRGVELVPATGRMRTFLPPEITALPGVRYAITSNGAAVYDLTAEKPIRETLLSNEQARQVQAVLDEYDLYIEYYWDGGAWTRAGNPERAVEHYRFPEDKWHFIFGKAYTLAPSYAALLETGICPEKINLPYVPEPQRGEIWRRLEELGGLRLTSSLPDNIEINHADAHKGAALAFLAERLGFSREELMAVGDNGNDVTMLEAAGLSFAVTDGDPAARAAATRITAAHDADGLAQAIVWALA